MNRILLFIPMYNCEKQIIRVLNQLDEKVAKYVSKVIIVNNRSTDNGEEAVEDYLRNNESFIPISLLRNQENYGLGGSHKVAFQYAIDEGFDYIITLHGDDQGCIKDLFPYIENGIYEKYNCILGSRFYKGSRLEGYSKFRTFGNIVYNLIFSIATLKKIYDLGAGLNMYNVNMFKDKHYIKFSDDLTFNYFQVLALRYYNHTFKFFPLVWREDDQISNVKMLNQAVKTLVLVVKSIINPKKFFQGEHRTVSRENYSAQEIFCSKAQQYEEEIL